MSVSPGVDVVFAIDERYVLPLATCLTSMADNTADLDRLRVTVLHDGLSDGAVSRLAACLPAGGLRFRYVDDDRLTDLPLPERIAPHITSMTLVRLVVPQRLPDVDRFVYLDADLLVLGDITELAAVPLHGRPVAAVVDPIIPTWGSSGGLQNPDLVARAPHTPYFNSGVMVVDAALWRRQGLTERAVAYGTRERDRLLLSDQEILNAVLGGDFVALDPVWNTSAHHLELEPPSVYQVRLDRCRILHFLAEHKPWLERSATRRVDHVFDRYVPDWSPPVPSA